MELISDKSAMRRQFRLARNEYVASLSPQDSALAFSVTPSPLAALFQPGLTIAGYFAVGSEANPDIFLKRAAEIGCAICMPYVTSKVSPMRFLSWAIDDTLEKGPMGLWQPPADNEELTPDIIMTPLVAFDRRLSRLGQGAGHYDRALSLLDNAITLGIAWSVQETSSVPTDPWDIPLDAILTEKEWITR
jgi:5-formyltetrahydrofolate cyclo-ligase